jgi:hypothetical protein
MGILTGPQEIHVGADHRDARVHRGKDRGGHEPRIGHMHDVGSVRPEVAQGFVVQPRPEPNGVDVRWLVRAVEREPMNKDPFPPFVGTARRPVAETERYDGGRVAARAEGVRQVAGIDLRAAEHIGEVPR